MNESEIIAKFLNEISGDIENIDGGCPDYISSFCDNINDVLQKYSLKIEHSDDYPITVKISNL